MKGIDITIDPKPEYPGHEQWDSLLSSVQSIVTKDGEIVNRALCMIRAAGARLEKQENGRLKIIPMYEPEGHWRNKEEWEEWAIPTLTRFKDEVKRCLESLQP